MDTAKIINDGDTQVIRLPETYHLDCDEVYIKKTPKGVLLIPNSNSIWDVWEANLNKYDEPFMEDRNQPKSKQF